MQLIDTHAHIYLPEFDADHAAMLERAKNTGISHIIMPAIDAQTHEAMTGTEDTVCSSMMGLHPCSVNTNYLDELKTVSGYLSGRSFRAIGEIGLDFYWDKTFVAQQYAAFEQQMAWSVQYGLPVVIHSRNAMDE